MKNNQNFLYCIVFAVAALSKFDVTLTARVPFGELVAFAAIPFLLRGQDLRQVRASAGPIVAILMIWALGILISDLANGMILPRFARGIMKPIFSCCWMLFFIGVLLRDYRALLFYPLGTIVAALQNYIFPQAFTIERVQAGGYEAVAYGIVPIISAVFVSIAVLLYRKSHLWSFFAFMLTAVVLLIAGSPRNNVAIILLNASVIAYVWWTHRSGRGLQLSGARLVGICLALVCAFTVIYYAYIIGAGHGWLGEGQRTKLEYQSNTIFGASPIGLVLGGRTAVFAAILAIWDNPLIGYGSWTGWSMTDYYYDAVRFVGTDARQLNLIASANGFLGPGHSILFAGWMENGILTAIALLSVLYLMLRQFLYMIVFNNPLLPLFIFMGTSFLWHFFFSPFGTGSRLVIGLFMALYVTKFCMRAHHDQGNRRGWN